MCHFIRFFLVDLDGCVTEPFTTPDWAAISQLRALSDQSQNDPSIPQLSICTGRPSPYAECVAQWLNVRVPILFECGAGLLDVSTQKTRWHPSLSEESQIITDVAKAYLRQLSQRHPEVNPEISKRFDAGITLSDPALTEQLLPEFSAFIHSECPQLEVHHTDISISAVWPQANKGAGIEWFCQQLEVEQEQVAFIGDTGGDIPALKAAGWGFAPENAKPAVKAQAKTVTQASYTHAVIEAWETLIQHNRQCQSVGK